MFIIFTLDLQAASDVYKRQILSCGILSPVSAIWGLIEGILLLAGETSKDAYGNDLKE